MGRSKCALGDGRDREREIGSAGLQDAPRLKALMGKYRDLPMDLADAGLVRVAERDKLSRIFTLDRRHFRVYRPAGIGRFSILPS